MKKMKYLLGFLTVLLSVLVFSGCDRAIPPQDGTASSTVQTTPTMSTTPTEPTVKKPQPYRPEPRPAPTEPTEHPLKQDYLKDRAAFVVFDSSYSEYIYVPIQEIMEYESLYPDCNGTWFKNQLSGEDLCIYNAFLYAMEHCYTWFELYVEDNDKDFYYVREALSLDSPFLEQNANRYETIHSHPSDFVGESISFTINSFLKERWDKKLEALEKCRQIVEDIPASCTTQTEKAAYLYRYVCKNMRYSDYKNMADNDYLYDAVCKGESVCDGYSNMLNLLFNLAGIESCEAMGYNIENLSEASLEELKNAGGHTWVVGKIDGEFYNFDPTWEDSKQGVWPSDMIFFCYSDLHAPVKYISFEQQRPKCTDTAQDYSYADLILDGLNGGAPDEILALVEKRASEGEQSTLLAFRGGLDGEDLNEFYTVFDKNNLPVRPMVTLAFDVPGATLLWVSVKDLSR